MLFKRVSRSDPEKVFIVVKNTSAATLADGYVVEWDFTTEKDGVCVIKPTTLAVSLGNAVAGVAVESIVDDAYGLIQVYGYHSAVRARACTSDDAIALGSGLRPPLAGGVWCCEGQDPDGTLNYKTMGFALSIWSSWASSTISAFLKCL